MGTAPAPQPQIIIPRWGWRLGARWTRLIEGLRALLLHTLGSQETQRDMNPCVYLNCLWSEFPSEARNRDPVDLATEELEEGGHCPGILWQGKPQIKTFSLRKSRWLHRVTLPLPCPRAASPASWSGRRGQGVAWAAVPDVPPPRCGPYLPSLCFNLLIWKFHRDLGCL